MSKLMSLDIGDVRIGVAISDENKKFSLPLEVIDRSKIKAIYRIKDLIRQNNVDTLIVGLPKRLNGNCEIQVDKIKKFMEKVQQKIKNICIIYVDERFTTKLAESYLKNSKKNTKESRKIVDMIAANIILQNYLDSIK